MKMIFVIFCVLWFVRLFIRSVSFDCEIFRRCDVSFEFIRLENNQNGIEILRTVEYRKRENYHIMDVIAFDATARLVDDEKCSFRVQLENRSISIWMSFLFLAPLVYFFYNICDSWFCVSDSLIRHSFSFFFRRFDFLLTIFDERRFIRYRLFTLGCVFVANLWKFCLMLLLNLFSEFFMNLQTTKLSKIRNDICTHTHTHMFNNNERTVMTTTKTEFEKLKFAFCSIRLLACFRCSRYRCLAVRNIKYVPVGMLCTSSSLLFFPRLLQFRNFIQ